MSADLELRRELPEIRLPNIRISNSQSQQSSTDDNSGIIQIEKYSDSESEECRTPTSPEHMIPTIINCPPAPRKSRPPATAHSYKRKLQFFESTGGEEVESFFRSVFELNSLAVVAKRRRHTLPRYGK